MVRRYAMRVEGIVQGVGFRPFVYGLAQRFGLVGSVRNEAGCVLIEIEGSDVATGCLIGALQAELPPAAVIHDLSIHTLPTRGDRWFEILLSTRDGSNVFVASDLAMCDDCRSELFDPDDRRYLYPFLSCTHCGPRLTITERVPFDRANTSLRCFTLCADCRAEYEDPGDRRFHAQAIACSACGPQLRLLDEQAAQVDIINPLGGLVRALQAGKIGALKGLGGYHLVCLARDDAAVRALRTRKGRNEKPFAIMVQNVESANIYCYCNESERRLLLSPRRPIVLLTRRPAREETALLSPSVAPHSRDCGVMLPYTPLHELLLEQVAEPLVMTSANLGDEPIIYCDREAVERLQGVADLILTHNRPIQVRCDDSVLRIIDEEESPIRRSRGYAPEPLQLPMECPKELLAAGGHLKSVFALSRGSLAFLSHHLGDLEHLTAIEAFRHDLQLYQRLFAIRPQAVVHDLHPDYASTRLAIDLAKQQSIPSIAVQHHHAHMASCMAEHGLVGDVIGVVFDGSGLGSDGTIWGGEFLMGGYTGFQRRGHLRPVPLPGGDQATREIWRIAASHARDAGCDVHDLFPGVPTTAWRVTQQMLERSFRSPITSSAGRLFDAVAALAGVAERASYEGQAAVRLEALASTASTSACYPYEFNESEVEDLQWSVDTRPLIRSVITDRRKRVDEAFIARRFHNTLTAIIGDMCKKIENATGLNRVVLSGGVFLNALLSKQVMDRMRDHGFAVYAHHRVPPSDGGLCLGQLAIAAQQLQSEALVRLQDTSACS